MNGEVKGLKMLKSKKNVFWEALIVAIAVFLAGLFFGMLMESSNTNKINNLYTSSQISLTDAMALSTLSESKDFDCDSIKRNNIEFADRVYKEAVLLEQYEEAGKLSESIKLLHKKYSLLRTLIWSSNQDSLERCQNYNLVVYLYESESEDAEVRARQNVWSKLLENVKKSYSDDVLLLPIAGNQDLSSLDLLINEFNVTQFPVVIVNNEYVLYDLDNEGTIEVLLD